MVARKSEFMTESLTWLRTFNALSARGYGRENKEGDFANIK